MTETLGNEYTQTQSAWSLLDLCRIQYNFYEFCFFGSPCTTNPTLNYSLKNKQYIRSRIYEHASKHWGCKTYCVPLVQTLGGTCHPRPIETRSLVQMMTRYARHSSKQAVWKEDRLFIYGIQILTAVNLKQQLTFFTHKSCSHLITDVCKLWSSRLNCAHALATPEICWF